MIYRTTNVRRILFQSQNLIMFYVGRAKTYFYVSLPANLRQMFKRIILLLFFFIGNLTFSNAESYLEGEPEQADSISLNNSDEPTQRSWFRDNIQSLIFRNPQPQSEESENTTKSETEPLNFEGKIIREIFVEDEVPSNLGRYFHVSTRPFVIRKLLLFGKNDSYDSLRIRESERLIRAQRYIDRGRIEVVPIAGCPDSIDVRVLIRDAFGFVPEGQLSSSRFGVGLRAINLLGLGHQIRSFYTWNRDIGLNNYMYAYDIPNFAGTYINAGALYRNNPVDTTETKRLSFQRPFYSFFARWAGGVELMQETQQRNVFLPGIVEPVLQRLRYSEQDYWAAYALKSLREENQNFILSARYYRIDYTKKPLSEFDPLHIYSGESLYLLGFGFSERKYKQDRYLLKFGFIEDVPVGQKYSLVGGIQNKNGLNRLYLGTTLSRGQYTRWGYVEMLIECGSFFDNIKVEEGVFRSEFNYFSPLIEINGWKIRQFFRPQLVLGFNRLATDRVTLNDYFGISGFNSTRPFGTQKIVGHLQTNIYSPYALWGFRIGGYLSFSMGMLGDEKRQFSHSKAYSAIGSGLMFRNDRLVFNSFKFGVSYFPYIPDEGHHIFKMNLYELQNFSYYDFDINKPDVIQYR